MRRLRYVLFIPFRDWVWIPIECYEPLSECSMKCRYNKGGCTLFEEGETMKRERCALYGDTFPYFMRSDCPRLEDAE